MRRGIAALLLFAATGALADQYHSQVRELPNPPPQSTPPDEQQMLQQTTDPYAKALLLRDLAGRAANDKHYAQAAQLLREALNLNALAGPAQQEMRRQLGQLSLAQGGGAAQLPTLEAQLKADPHPGPDLQAAVGAAYVETKRYAEAIPLLQKALSAVQTPEASWRRALAAAYLGAGRERDAAPLLEQLLKENPSVAEDWRRYAAVLQRTGDDARALAVLDIANRVGALGAEDRLRYVALAARLGMPFRAASALQEWMSSGQIETSTERYRQLAALWADARETALALDALQQVRARAPSAELELQIGQLQLDRGDYDGAAASLQRAIASGAKTGPAWLGLATAYTQLGQREPALKAYRAAAEVPATRKYAEPWIAILEAHPGLKPAQRAPALPPSKPDSAYSAPPIKLSAADARAPPPRLPAPAATAGPAVGAELTPVGAERAGSADGQIPAWTGGLKRSDWPAAFKPDGHLQDPWPDEKPLFTITSANLGKYRAHLAPGYLALFAKYPDYTMPVYPTHRSVGYPQAILDASLANVGKARLVGSDTLKDAHLGFPFPQPESGVEAMWNHRLRYRGDSVESTMTQAVVGPDGPGHMVKETDKVWFRYGNVADPIDLSKDNILLYLLTMFSRPSGGLDFLVLVHESANSIEKPRAIWVLPAIMKTRMFRIPPVGYDQPFPDSEGLMFVDMVDMYNGAFDRYVWKLTGKRELYIPYNSYRISDGRYRYSQLLTPHHFNQAATRYELHRCWVIQAIERGGKHHAFGTRTFYLDEDSWNVVLVENDDHDGRLWRFQEGHILPDYQHHSATAVPLLVYDLKDGRYFATRLAAEDPPPTYDLPGLQLADFMPDQVKARYGH